MLWDNVERRSTPCQAHSESIVKLEEDIRGNGKPGLLIDVELIKFALYGDDKKREHGVIQKQQKILNFVNKVESVFWPFVILSVMACLNILGVPIGHEIQAVLRIFI